MNRYILILFVLLSSLNVSASKHKLKEVLLSDYGLIDNQHISQTIEKAISDIDGKRLIFPNQPIDVENIAIRGKSHFAIVGCKKHPITCKDFRIDDCNDFDLSSLFIKGTKEKFATFHIVGDCERFQIHDCLFDSEKGKDGHNTFYGIHIVTDTNKPNYGYHNSPRNFKVYNNDVNNTRYDGILAHAYCSDFRIEKNRIVGAECIGIESEGRLGGVNNTTVHPCKNAVIRNNEMLNCGDWGILLMWTENVKVYDNRCINSYGAFLSIGCKDVIVKNNIFEGRNKGFEISQEFFKISNGINSYIKVFGNIIRAKARAGNRGVLDIRHARNVVIRNNEITSLYRDNTAYVSLASCQDIEIKKNRFSCDGKPLQDSIYRINVPDPETKQVVSELNICNTKIQEIKIRK